MALRVERKKKGRRRWIVGLLVLVLLVWGMNAFLYSRPASVALAADPHTSGMALAAHLRYYLDPTTLILDLKRANVADPVDLFRGLLRAVKKADDATWIPATVVLLRSGTPVYTIAGADISRLAYEFSIARNPNSVVIQLPGKLRLPGGGPLPPMQVSDAASRWGGARP